jgi:glycerol uptake facilitator-like aquaporin
MLAEFLGTSLLVAVIVGSGIAAETLSPDPGIRLLANSLATALALYALIAVLQPISGAHLNPVISVISAALRRDRWRDALAFLPAQVAGAVTGAVLANTMFGLDPVQVGTADRWSWAHALSEVVATAGLVMVVFTLARTARPQLIAPAVAAYIGAAYWFTSSTSFANPAVTVGRVFTDTLAGISPGAALGFLAAQLVGGACGLGLVVLLAPSRSR